MQVALPLEFLSLSHWVPGAELTLQSDTPGTPARTREVG